MKFLHEMPAKERIENVKAVLEQNHVPQNKWGLASYLMGVQSKHALETKKISEKMISEAMSGQQIDEANVTGDVTVVAKMMAPMVLRGFSQSAATDICGTWPMKSDQGKIAYMRNYYTNDLTNAVKPSASKILVLSTVSGLAVAGAITSSGTGVGVVRYIDTNTTSVLIEVTSGSFVAAESFDNASPYSAPAGTISAVFSAELAPRIFSDYTKFASIAAGEAAAGTIKEVEVGVDLMNVEAEDHKLRMRYTREFEAKMRDYYGIDAEGLTDGVMSLAFRQELNRRVFVEVHNSATTGGTSTWDYATDSDGRWEEEIIKTLMTYLNVRSADILQSNYIEQGNYVVADTITFAFLNSYGYVDMSSLPSKMAQPMKDPNVGILNGMFKTYINPWITTRTVDMGMKDFSNDPEAETRAGLFFHPYLGVDITRTVNADDGQPVKFAWTMWGFTNHPMKATTGTNDFFRRIDLDNLPNL